MTVDPKRAHVGVQQVPDVPEMTSAPARRSVRKPLLVLYNLAFVFLKVVLNVAFVVVAAPVIGTVGIAAIVFEEVKMHRGRRALREWSIFALIFEDDSCYVGVGLTQSFWNPPHIARASWPCEPDPRALVLATMSGTDRDAQAEVLAWMWAAHTAG